MRRGYFLLVAAALIASSAALGYRIGHHDGYIEGKIKGHEDTVRVADTQRVAAIIDGIGDYIDRSVRQKWFFELGSKRYAVAAILEKRKSPSNQEEWLEVDLEAKHGNNPVVADRRQP